MHEQHPPEASQAPRHILEIMCTLCHYSKETRLTKELLDNVKDANQLSRRLNELSPTERSNCIAALILRATASPTGKKFLMSLPEPTVLDILEETRGLLEGAKNCVVCMTDPERRTHLLRRLLTALSRNTQMVPRSFIIKNIQLQDRDAVSGGGFADIFRASYQGQPVALKRLRNFRDSPVSEEEKDAFRKEALVSWFLDHLNIQSFMGIDDTTFSPLLCIVSPWQENGDILGWLVRCDALGLPILLDELIRQILTGLGYLHDNNIIHGDLRGANILIDGHCIPKLADFGLSVLHGAGSSTMGRFSGGTTRFMAPEVIIGEGAQISFDSDIYSFACVCVELHTRQHPFSDIIPEIQVIAAVLKGARPRKPSEPTNSLDGFWETLEPCWNHDPLTRPKACSLISSLPLRKPALAPRDSAALPHANWMVPTSELQNLCHPHLNPPCTLDSCILGLLDYDTAHVKTVQAMQTRLEALGCPQEVARFVWEGRVDGKTIMTKPVSPTPVIASEEGPATTPSMITASVSPDQGAPVQGTLESAAELAKSFYDRGGQATKRSHHHHAQGYYLRAVQLQRDLAREKPDKYNSPLAYSLHNLAHALSKLGEYKDAVMYGRQAVNLRRDLARENPDEFTRDLASSLYNLAFDLSELGEYIDAVTYGRQAVDILRDLARETPDEVNRTLAYSLHNLARCFSKLGEYTDAVIYGRQAVELLQDLAQGKPNGFNRDLANSLHRLSRDLSTLGAYKDAAVYCRQAVDLSRDLALQDANNYKPILADNLDDFTYYSEQLGRHEDVVKSGREAIKIYSAIAPNSRKDGQSVVKCFRRFAASLRILGFVDEARQVDREAKKVERIFKASTTQRNGLMSFFGIFRGRRFS